MLTSVVARSIADAAKPSHDQFLAFVRLHARAIACILAFSGITVVLVRTEPWKLCLLAVVGLIMLPVLLQHSFLVHESKVADVALLDTEPSMKGSKKDKSPLHDHHNQQVLLADMPSLPAELAAAAAVPTTLPPVVVMHQDPSYSISLPPLLELPAAIAATRKGLMPKNVLQIREEMFAKAMGSLRSLSPRNKPVVHHLDLIKYAEEIDQDDATFL
ncbi:Aste57867_2397 [Aphanomyces stellatus]|uniref:Aste57867_2397 protein n=1 Tax=Aphanomyces stellatus TaxID=120398 RepID=A0A485K8X6_9STRA|nr:hypothetical protein As57867_002391 [Aphanomyces stellatus]VFT79598.1 Aste57867_2397 [Aphanomyces stellatus]